MSELQLESYGDHTNDFKKARETQTYKTALMYHNKLLDQLNISLKDTHDDVKEIKQTLSFHQVQVQNEFITVNQRLSALENPEINRKVFVSPPEPIMCPIEPISTIPIQEIIPNIIKAKNVIECIDQYCKGWDNIIPLMRWKIEKPTWTTGKNRVLFVQREFIGKLYIHYVKNTLDGHNSFIAKYGARPIGKVRDLCRIELTQLGIQ